MQSVYLNMNTFKGFQTAIWSRKAAVESKFDLSPDSV